VLGQKANDIDEEVSLLHELKEIVLKLIHQINQSDFSKDSDIKLLYDSAKELEEHIVDVDRLTEVSEKLTDIAEKRLEQGDPILRKFFKIKKELSFVSAVIENLCASAPGPDSIPPYRYIAKWDSLEEFCLVMNEIRVASEIAAKLLLEINLELGGTTLDEVGELGKFNIKINSPTTEINSLQSLRNYFEEIKDFVSSTATTFMPRNKYRSYFKDQEGMKKAEEIINGKRMHSHGIITKPGEMAKYNEIIKDSDLSIFYEKYTREKFPNSEIPFPEYIENIRQGEVLTPALEICKTDALRCYSIVNALSAVCEIVNDPNSEFSLGFYENIENVAEDKTIENQ